MFIFGTGDADTLIGTDDADTLVGFTGDDTLIGGLGDDEFDGGAGIDTVVFSGPRSSYNVSLFYVVGPDGSDYFRSNIEFLRFSDQTVDVSTLPRVGTEGDDILSGARVIYGLGGNDDLIGADGGSTLIGGLGNDRMWGGIGYNTAVFSGLRSSYTITQSPYIGGGQYVVGPDGSDWVSGISALQFDDQTVLTSSIPFVGTEQDDYIAGSYGSDIIYGLGGNDFLVPQWGDDWIDGGDGYDTVVFSNEQAYYAIEWRGYYVIRSPDGNVELHSVERVNFSGSSFFPGTSDLDDILVASNLGDFLPGGKGNDTLVAGWGYDTLDGGEGRDTADYSTTLSGVTVDLRINGAQDTLGSGLDTIRAVENVTGSNYADSLTGDAGANVLKGNDGDDVLVGLGGDDTLNGGAGKDTAVYSGPITAYSVRYDADSDVLHLTDNRGGSPEGSDALTGVESATFSDGSDFQIDAANLTPWAAVGTVRDARGSIQSQTVAGDHGTYWVNQYDTDNSQSWLWMTSHYDAEGRIMSVVGTRDDGTHWVGMSDTANTGGWASAIYFYSADWRPTGSDSSSDLNPSVSADAEAQVAFDNLVWFTTPYDPDFTSPGVANRLVGGDGADVLYGFGGDDLLAGGQGNDVLVGGSGADRLAGGTGADRFVFSTGSGEDIIADFAPSQGDVIDLRGFGIASFAELQPLISTMGQDTFIALNEHDSIRLQELAPSALSSSDFLFG